MLKEDWYIKYRFYDDILNKSKQVVVRVNEYDTVSDRITYVKGVINQIIQLLEIQEMNPITGFIKESDDNKDINKYTLLPDALKFARNSVRLSELTMRDIDSMLPNVLKHAQQFHYDRLCISEITRKHWRRIFDACAIKKDGEFSNDKYNRYRSYMGILCSELMEYDVIDANIPLSLKPKEKAIKRIRETLTMDERVKIDNYLKEKYPRFRLLMHIFFHSGARETELMRVKVSDVDFDHQRVKYLVKKGKGYREVYRPMKDIAVPFWKEAVAGAAPDMYVFTRLLKPGYTPIQSYQLNKRWIRLVKKRLGVTADFYSLKHLNSTETAKKLGISAAALQNAEAEDMIRKHYDVDSESREHDALKRIDNKFSE